MAIELEINYANKRHICQEQHSGGHTVVNTVACLQGWLVNCSGKGNHWDGMGVCVVLVNTIYGEFTNTHINTHTCTHIYSCTHFTYMYIQHVHIHTLIHTLAHTHTHIHTQGGYKSWGRRLRQKVSLQLRVSPSLTALMKDFRYDHSHSHRSIEL